MLIGIINRFPQFRGRENKIGTIEDRINGCMERSMNGNPLPPNGIEMQAFVAYMEWLSRYAPEDGKVKGAGYARINIPNRRVDLEKGEKLFLKKCASCHGGEHDFEICIFEQKAKMLKKYLFLNNFWAIVP